MWLAPVLLADYWSPRINDQWRIVFRWDGKEALDVEITDYYRWDEMLPKKRPPTHPGQMLLKEFLEPLGFEHRFRDDSVTVSTAAMQDLTPSPSDTLSALFTLRLPRTATLAGTRSLEFRFLYK